MGGVPESMADGSGHFSRAMTDRPHGAMRGMADRPVRLMHGVADMTPRRFLGEDRTRQQTAKKQSEYAHLFYLV